jgi:manganese/zinc/iron transport system substrate-binding protein
MTIRPFKQRLALILLLLVLIVPNAIAQPKPLKIVATTTQASDLMRILLSGVPEDAVIVTGLMGAGVDPHLFKPTESDVRAMNEADAIFYSGLHLEGQLDNVFEALRERRILTFAVSKPVHDLGYTFGGFQLSAELVNVEDPHFWFDPRNWQLSTIATGEQLILLLPEYAELIQANTDAYVAQLDVLFEWATEAMQTVNEPQRVLVTSHDAFNYFGDAFGWQVRGLQGLSTQDEAGVGDIQALVQFLIEQDVPVMFVESSVPPNAIIAVREAAAAERFEIRLGITELYSDAMGAPDDFGGTYIGMIAQNVAVIVRSFGETLPAWPEGLEPVLPESLLELSYEQE